MNIQEKVNKSRVITRTKKSTERKISINEIPDESIFPLGKKCPEIISKNILYEKIRGSKKVYLIDEDLLEEIPYNIERSIEKGYKSSEVYAKLIYELFETKVIYYEQLCLQLKDYVMGHFPAIFLDKITHDRQTIAPISQFVVKLA